MKLKSFLFFTVAVLCAFSYHANAGINNPGSGSATVHGGASVINIPYGQHINLFKNANIQATGTIAWPGFLNADGYIAGADPGVTLSGNYNNPFANYYGHFTVSYAGRGTMNLSTTAIIYSGGASLQNVLPVAFANSGQVVSNFLFLDKTAPQVEFAYGALVGGIQNNGAGKVQLTPFVTSGFASLQSGIGTVQINNINGITPGLYSINVLDATHADIASLTYNVGTMSVIGGSPGAMSEMIFAPTQGNYSWNTGFTATWSMSNAILCRTGDYANCVAGKQWNPDFVAQFRDQLKPGFARFMDVSKVNGSLATNFTYRPKNSNFTFENFDGSWVPSYWVGTITNIGSDAYTAANPSGSPASGALIDGEVVQGQINAANTGNNPTLALTGRAGGAKPILSSNFTGAPVGIILGGTLTAGDVIHLTATASYLGGGSHTLNYTLTSTNPATEAGGLFNAINADTTFAAANISCANGSSVTGQVLITYNKNGQGVAPGAATVFSATVTGVGGEVISIGTMPTPAQDTSGVTAFTANLLVSMTYSKILDAWISAPGAVQTGASIESMVQFCNDANVGCWITFPILYSGASVTSFTQLVAANLNSNLNFAPELSNEVWNNVFIQTALAINLGASLGFDATNFGGVAFNSYYGLRFKQFQDLAKSAWIGAGRSVSALASPLADAEVHLANNPAFNDSLTYRLNGGALNTATNPTYNALAGLGGTAGTTYTTFPNRPVDDSAVVSVAPYWTGLLIGQVANDWSGSVGTYASILQAGKDYASGNPALMASALAAIDTDARNALATFGTGYTNIQTIISGYDSQRVGIGLAPLGRHDYEGGSQHGMGNTFQGTQDTANDATGYAPLSARFTTLGWNTSAYGASNDIVAQQVVTAYLAWKASSVFQATVTYSFQQVASAHPGRSVKVAWFGYTGPSLWQLFQTSSIYGTPQTSYNALQNWP